VLNMITGLPEADRRALWGDQASLTVECPRCGRSYEITRPLH
jgi:redox-regulated HSP33 family molecular chaperone